MRYSPFSLKCSEGKSIGIGSSKGKGMVGYKNKNKLEANLMAISENDSYLSYFTPKHLLNTQTTS